MQRPLSSVSARATGDEAAGQQSGFPGVQVQRVERLGACKDHESLTVELDVVDGDVLVEDLVWVSACYQYE